MSTIDLDRMKPAAKADVRGKRVLVRADLNVPVKDGTVTDATRIERFLPTVEDLASRGAKVIVLSHFGRPDGQRVAKMSLKPIAEAMAAMLKKPVGFAEDCIGDAAAKAVGAMRDGDAVVLENTRFHAGEEANDKAFTSALAANGDLYVNDAFSCAHRAHASTEGLAHVLPAFAGAQMMAEITALRTALEKPERPVMAIVGGSKVSTKIPVLSNLAKKVQHLVIGGGMANTFLLADGVKIGKSLAEPDFLATVAEIKAAAKSAGCTIHLPSDAVLAKKLEAGVGSRVAGLDGIAADEMILDIGPKSVAAVTAALGTCRTLLWNGPVGAFEISPFGDATFAIAREAARLTKAGKLVSVAGGGDTVAALNTAKVADDLTYVSTAGGAFLEWLEGRELPGVAALAR
ncbi:MAG: phosphoglycerate kinase [Hyphomicrobiaceae bacterium]